MPEYYQRFHPDLWRTNFNFEAMCTVITNDNGDLEVNGTFRTKGDYIIVYFQSEDKETHSYYRYVTNKDFTGCVLTFQAGYQGNVCPFNDRVQQPSVVIQYENGDEKFVTLGFFGVRHSGSSTVIFDGSPSLNHTWIVPEVLTCSWEKDTEEGTISGTGVLGDDFDVDFVNGIFFTKENSSIPFEAVVTLNYTYNTHESYTIDFDEIFEGVHPDLRTDLSPQNIDQISLSVIPTYFVQDSREIIQGQDDFTLTLSNITVTNGTLNQKPDPMLPHVYRVAEGFDDEYDKNPKRLIEQMKTLGYEKVINLYIGASHFYNKSGVPGTESLDHTSMTLDPTTGINHSFRAWLDSFIKHMKLNGFDELIVSVSMENLQMPAEWKQLMHDGTPGMTGWIPPTNFYSPNNSEAREWVRKITKEILDIVVNHSMPVILQLGEPWWWWQEFVPTEHGDMSTPWPGQPPCFYDEHTKIRYQQETGKQLKIYKRSQAFYNQDDLEIWEKLKQYLGEYSDFMKTIVKEYPDGKFTVLFFPPSVIDEGRVPIMMRTVNTPFDHWDDGQLDFIQVEDYDWVINQNFEHVFVYPFAWLELGYRFDEQHYFAGFVLNPEDAQKLWPVIEKAAAGAVGRGFLEVFIWAGTQIRRDSWIPKRNYYSSDCEYWRAVNMNFNI